MAVPLFVANPFVVNPGGVFPILPAGNYYIESLYFLVNTAVLTAANQGYVFRLNSGGTVYFVTDGFIQQPAGTWSMGFNGFTVPMRSILPRGNALTYSVVMGANLQQLNVDICLYGESLL